MISSQTWIRELDQRRREIWRRVESEGCDVLLIYSTRERPEPFRYLTNFVPNLGAMWGVMTGADEMSCFLNFHWELAEARHVSGLPNWYGFFDPLPHVLERVSQAAPERIAVLGIDHLPWGAYRSLVDADSRRDLIDLGRHLDVIRRTKSTLEIQLLEKAARLTDEAFERLRDVVQPGITENELAAEVVYLFRRAGAACAFRPLVIAGTDDDSAVIARSTRERPLQMGDTLMIDIGAQYQGYQADVARTWVLGRPSPIQQRVWSAVRRAYDRVVSMASPGIPCCELHEAAERVLTGAGFELKHRIGHGIGLATSFEWPSLDTETTLLEPGMTLAIEPAVYEVGAGAMKLEDSLVITEHGAEVISRSSRGWVLSSS